MVLFLRNKRFNVLLFWTDYYIRWWRLPIEERPCRKTDLGGSDYYLRNTGLPPSSEGVARFILEQKNQDLGSKRHATGETFFDFLFCTRFFPLNAIEILF